MPEAETPSPSQTPAPPSSPLRVVDFFSVAIKDSKLVAAIFENLEAMVKALVGAGFVEDQARRAVDFWLIDTGWSHLMNGTSLKTSTFFAMTGAPLLGPDVAKPAGEARPVPVPPANDAQPAPQSPANPTQPEAA